MSVCEKDPDWKENIKEITFKISAKYSILQLIFTTVKFSFENVEILAKFYNLDLNLICRILSTLC